MHHTMIATAGIPTHRHWNRLRIVEQRRTNRIIASINSFCRFFFIITIVI